MDQEREDYAETPTRQPWWLPSFSMTVMIVVGVAASGLFWLALWLLPPIPARLDQ
jgi:hypothetical protein